MDQHQLFPAERKRSTQGGSPVELREDLRYIVIEGVIGVGKTTLAKMLAQRFGGRLVLEAFHENPFLERFYQDRNRWAFQTQLSFLAHRFKQQNSLLKPDLFHNLVVSDYSFDKDKIFAHQNLKGDELQLYESLFNLMQPRVPVPDLVVYLQASTKRLLQNIKLRGRPFENAMDPAYLEALNEAYNYFYFRYTDSPLLIINAEDVDFVRNEEELDEIVRQIVTTTHPGTTYFNPVSRAS